MRQARPAKPRRRPIDLVVVSRDENGRMLKRLQIRPFPLACNTQGDRWDGIVRTTPYIRALNALLQHCEKTIRNSVYGKRFRAGSSTMSRALPCEVDVGGEYPRISTTGIASSLFITSSAAAASSSATASTDTFSSYPGASERVGDNDSQTRLQAESDRQRRPDRPGRCIGIDRQ